MLFLSQTCSVFYCVCSKTTLPTTNTLLITIDNSALKYFQANIAKPTLFHLSRHWCIIFRQYGKYFNQLG